MNLFQKKIQTVKDDIVSAESAAGQKRCKECGEYFTPRSMRQQYCDKIHYRPCPVCGKLVEAKYLSDPPRCCSKECQQKSRKKIQDAQHKEVVDRVKIQEEITISTRAASRTAEQWLGLNLFGSVNKSLKNEDINKLEGKIRKKFDVRTYIEQSVLGFETGHEYALVITKPKGYATYEVTAVYDFDEGKIVDNMIPLSSQISINRHFAN